jgi:hypothetical protein
VAAGGESANLQHVAGEIPSVSEVIDKLLGVPVTLEHASSPGGLPKEPGLYAWWTVRGSIPGVPQCPHPTQDRLDLFYVGIAPKDASSRATLRSRVRGNHIRGNTGSSTFRQTLASLLFENRGWKPRMTDRPLLTSEDNKELMKWQHQHLRLTWAIHPRPWEIEHEVIRRVEPPLDLAGNQAHPFWQTLTDARKRFKQAAAKAATTPPTQRRPTMPSASPRRPAVGRSSSQVTLNEEIAPTSSKNMTTP